MPAVAPPPGPRPDAGGPPVRIGVLGYSDIAVRKFLPALRNCSRAALAGIASRFPAQTAMRAPSLASAVRTYDELVTAPDVEAVYVSLPNHLHEEWVLRCLEEGKHVICEKPLGLDPGSVERMVETARRNGLLLTESLMFIHHPQHRLVREMLRGGTIGRLVTLRSVFGVPRPAEGNFRLDPAHGGGAFHDLARYPIGTALYFLQGTLGSFTGCRTTRDGLTMSTHGMAVSSADEVFTFSVAFGQQYECYYELIGDRGKIRVDRAYTPPADMHNRISVLCGNEDRSVTAPADDHFRGMLDHVCRLIDRREGYEGEYRAIAERARIADLMDQGCTGGKAAPVTQ